MTQAWKTLLVSWLGLYGLAYAQPQSRSELIDSERAKKEANLTPEKPPKAEWRLQRIEHSWPYRMLAAGGDGFGVASGGLLPGWGFAIGPRYTRNNLWDGKLTARAEFRAAINQSYLGRVDLALPRLFNDRAFLNFSTINRNISEMPYYGSGPQSRKTGAEQLPNGGYKRRAASRSAHLQRPAGRHNRLFPSGQRWPGTRHAVYFQRTAI
jgi:hypothetical protein